jgi:hypothetical protein
VFWLLRLQGSCTEENGNLAESQSQGSKPSQLGSQAQDKGFLFIKSWILLKVVFLF